MTKRSPGRHRAPGRPTGSLVPRKLARAGLVVATVAACSSVATVPALAAGPVTTIPSYPASGPPVTIPNRPASPPVAAPSQPTTRQAMPTVRYGSRGSAVVTLQRALRIPADGIFGPITLRAVRNWQASHGLVADGVVGPRTWASLGYR